MSPPIMPYTLSPHIAPLEIHDGRVVYPSGFSKRRKVAICGAGGARQMPWDDPTFECWSLNNFWNTSRDREGRIAASRWWEQHQIFANHSGPSPQDENDMAWIRECPVPLYTTEPFPDNPRATVWPIDAMARKYRDYFVCTFAMQICQVLEDGFEELHVFGLDLLNGTKREATFEAACVAYWLGLAEGRGVRVVLGPYEGLRRQLGKRSWDAFGALWKQERPDVNLMFAAECPTGRMRPDEQLLLRHPFRYGHDYHEESNWVRGHVARWDERPVAI